MAARVAARMAARMANGSRNIEVQFVPPTAPNGGHLLPAAGSDADVDYWSDHTGPVTRS
jgi:hypothetical protein